MIKTITKKFTFESSHRLYDGSLSDEENEKIFGKCFNKPGHGHSYKLYVTVSGKEKNGMIINFRDLKLLVNEYVIEVFDHHFINDLNCMENKITTCENMIEVIWGILNIKLIELTDGEVRLEKLQLYETEDSSSEMTR